MHRADLGRNGRSAGAEGPAQGREEESVRAEWGSRAAKRGEQSAGLGWREGMRSRRGPGRRGTRSAEESGQVGKARNRGALKCNGRSSRLGVRRIAGHWEVGRDRAVARRDEKKGVVDGGLGCFDRERAGKSERVGTGGAA